MVGFSYFQGTHILYPIIFCPLILGSLLYHSGTYEHMHSLKARFFSPDNICPFKAGSSKGCQWLFRVSRHELYRILGEGSHPWEADASWDWASALPWPPLPWVWRRLGECQRRLRCWSSLACVGLELSSLSRLQDWATAALLSADNAWWGLASEERDICSIYLGNIYIYIYIWYTNMVSPVLVSKIK